MRRHARRGAARLAAVPGDEAVVVDAASAAALEVGRVRDDPRGRYELAASFYRHAEGARRRYGAAELSFLRWELSRGVLAPPGADVPGSPWWRAVNERLLRDKAEGRMLAAGARGGAGTASVELWVAFVERPGPGAWYRAHNASIVGAYLEHEALTAAELRVERFMMNVALVRVLYAHALVARPQLAWAPWRASVLCSATHGDRRSVCSWTCAGPSRAATRCGWTWPRR